MSLPVPPCLRRLVSAVLPAGVRTALRRNRTVARALRLIAAGALDKLKKAKPAAFTHVRNAALITTGNLVSEAWHGSIRRKAPNAP